MLFTHQKKLKRKLKKFIIVLFGLYVMIGSALYFFQEKILFLPTTLEQDYQYKFNSIFEELFLKPEANVIINALHFKTNNPKGVILYFHGNAGDLSRWGGVTEYFANLNYDVLVMDYRTYGKSTGKLNEKGLYSDAQYCYDYLLNHYSEDQIILYGRSLGTGIASYIASQNKPKQLILETPYYSILDVAKYRFPMFPLKRLLKYHFPTHQYLTKTECLITVIHGTNDNVVPFSSAKKLSNLELSNLNFIKVEGAGHSNLIEFEIYHKSIKNILK